MFWKKKDDLFSGMPNVFGIADDILIAEFDEHGRYHDETLEKVLQICRWSDLKLNIDKCLLRCTSIHVLSEIISQQGVSPDLSKIKS